MEDEDSENEDTDIYANTAKSRSRWQLINVLSKTDYIVLEVINLKGSMHEIYMRYFDETDFEQSNYDPANLENL